LSGPVSLQKDPAGIPREHPPMAEKCIPGSRQRSICWLEGSQRIQPHRDVNKIQPHTQIWPRFLSKAYPESKSRASRLNPPLSPYHPPWVGAINTPSPAPHHFLFPPALATLLVSARFRGDHPHVRCAKMSPCQDSRHQRLPPAPIQAPDTALYNQATEVVTGGRLAWESPLNLPARLRPFCMFSGNTRDSPPKIRSGDSMTL